MIHSISLGAGVQSTAMVLMAKHGLIKPMPDLAIFADTGAEPRKVYQHLEWLMTKAGLPFPIDVVKFSDLGEDIRRTALGEKDVAGRDNGYMAPPFHTLNEDGSDGLLRRECTTNYKIRPMHEHLKKKYGLDLRRSRGKTLVTSWVGISTDEAMRMKSSPEKWITKRYPLIELDISRQDCAQWTQDNGYPPAPRSACTFCPFHNNHEWRNLKMNHPEDWDDAVEIDRLIRDTPARNISGLRKGGQVFVHRALKPLDEVDVRTAEDAGQLNLFNNECEGVCGV